MTIKQRMVRASLTILAALTTPLLGACASGIKLQSLAPFTSEKTVLIEHEVNYSGSGLARKLVLPRGAKLVGKLRDADGTFFESFPGIQTVISIPVEGNARLLSHAYLRGGVYVPDSPSGRIVLWTIKDSSTPIRVKATDDVPPHAGWAQTSAMTNLIVNSMARTPLANVGAAAVGGAIGAAIVTGIIVAGDGEIFVNHELIADKPLRRELFQVPSAH